MISPESIPASGPAHDHPRCITARLGAGQADLLDRFPDRRHVLYLDPVQLDVLPVSDVSGARA